MSQRAALLISTAITAFTLLAALGLGVQVWRADAGAPAAGVADDGAGPTAIEIEQERQHREQFDRLQASNAALAASYSRIAGLLDDAEKLRAQNAELREREARYQERLAEANTRLQRTGQKPTALLPPATTTHDKNRDGRGSTHDDSDRRTSRSASGARSGDDSRD